ncbi:S8 family serine peptidase [Streptomyces sp. NPDC047022]|uniref:S8 family serine peptidase n=1 Tax=Streptomyces sp. NPDC047022 TaxID=3155737 RepID=UPI0033F0D5FA
MAWEEWEQLKATTAERHEARMQLNHLLDGAVEAADGGNGTFGLAPAVKILPVRMPKSTTAANEAASIQQFNQVLPKAIRYAADAGAQVINISMAAEEGSPDMTAAVKYALGEGSVSLPASVTAETREIRSSTPQRRLVS